MSIRIIPQETLEKRHKTAADWIVPLLFPQLKHLYSRRAGRLRALAENNPLGDYLHFAAIIASAQHSVLGTYAPQQDLRVRLRQAADADTPPLDKHTLPRDPHWQRLLHALLAKMKPKMRGQALSVINHLEKTDAQTLEKMADALLNDQFDRVGSDKAPFIWSALSLYWAQMASVMPGKGQMNYGEQRQFCPVCGSMPVAGVVHIGTQHHGLRYLHCNLCESEWYVTRAKCTNCEQTDDIHYWSLDSENASVRAESCGHCTSYIKLLYQEKDPATEAVADDLATLILDSHVEQEGYARSSLNPFLFSEK